MADRVGDRPLGIEGCSIRRGIASSNSISATADKARRTQASHKSIYQPIQRIFPQQWRAFRDHLPPERWDSNLAQAYNDLLMDPDPAVHNPAALAWCDWEDVHISLADGYRPGLSAEEPSFRLCFARLVTHYWANAAFLDEDHLLQNATHLADIPTYMSHGRLDVSSPIDFPLQLAEAIPVAELFIAEGDGHGGSAMTDWTISITDRYAGDEKPPTDRAEERHMGGETVKSGGAYGQ